MRLSIFRKFWNVVMVPKGKAIEEAGMAKSNYGLCESPDTIGKRIFIRDGLAPREELNTVFHEVIHAASWKWSEEAVQQLADDLEHAAWKFGWRKVEERED